MAVRPRPTTQTDTDFLDNQLQRQGGAAFIADLTGGQGQKYKQYRHTETIIEATLRIEPLPDTLRHRLVGHHTLAQCRVSGCQHGGKHAELEHGDPGEQDEPGDRSECNAQGKAPAIA